VKENIRERGEDRVENRRDLSSRLRFLVTGEEEHEFARIGEEEHEWARIDTNFHE
jgi:hypothetical protein